MFSEQKEKFILRRQYLLAPKIINSYSNWKHVDISTNYHLFVHPDLPVTIARCKNRCIYLLGYLIDADNPSLSDSQILQDVIDKSQTADEVFLHLASKCGRFVIITKIDENCRIFSDACGLRQVFYHIDNAGEVWCASQPHLIAEQRNLVVAEQIKNDLHKTALFKSEEHWYPGSITLFNDIFHLTPNHYFDCTFHKCIRYWPREYLSPISISECVPMVSSLLSGIIEGALKRFNLAFAISGGLDSRTLFAASRRVAMAIHYFTQTTQSNANSDPDVLIPTAMLAKFGLKHSVLMIPDKLDADFKEILQNNVFTARLVKGKNAISIYDYFKKEEKEIVVVYGNCSEITKRDRFRFPKTPKLLINGKSLAAMALMSKSSIAVNEFSHWLMPVKALTRYGIDILDLMHWEQRVGNWGAMSFSEYEMVYESLCPYSCRQYIEYMLRVPFKFRTRPEYQLHHAIIATNWPEALEYEINPEGNAIKRYIENYAYKTNIYDAIKYLHLMLYKRHR